MTHTITALILAAGLAGAASGATFTGVVTDTMCGTDHTHMGVSPPEKCIRECVKSGKYYYALAVGKKIYRLSDQKAPEPFAAKKVTVTGTLYEKTGIIKVDKIEAAR